MLHPISFQESEKITSKRELMTKKVADEWWCQKRSPRIFPSLMPLCNGHHVKWVRRVGCELECNASTPSRQPAHIFQADENRSCNHSLVFYFTDDLLSLFPISRPHPPPLSVLLRAVWFCLQETCPFHFALQSHSNTMTARSNSAKDEGCWL